MTSSCFEAGRRPGASRFPTRVVDEVLESTGLAKPDEIELIKRVDRPAGRDHRGPRRPGPHRRPSARRALPPGGDEPDRLRADPHPRRPRLHDGRQPCELERQPLLRSGADRLARRPGHGRRLAPRPRPVPLDGCRAAAERHRWQVACLSMSAEDLERYEAEIELQLYKEYKDVCPMFGYVVETERRFYLANDVDRTSATRTGERTSSSSCATPGCGTCTAPAVSCPGEHRDVQGRQHRGARRRATETLVVPVDREA